MQMDSRTHGDSEHTIERQMRGFAVVKKHGTMQRKNRLFGYLQDEENDEHDTEHDDRERPHGSGSAHTINQAHTCQKQRDAAHAGGAPHGEHPEARVNFQIPGANQI